MTRIAIISDIHGNLTALTEVINDIEKRGIKIIYCLGDIISKGVYPSECLSILKNKCQIILRGNCDEILCSSYEDCEGIERERRIWVQSMLTIEEKDYLLNLPYCYEFYMSGSLIRLFHAHPDKIDRMVSTLDTLERKRELFLPTNNTETNEIADVVIYGHTHIQFLEKYYNRTLINVGSVGNSIDVVRNDNFDADNMETTKASYLIIEGELDSKDRNNSISFQFVKVPYDIKKELSSEIMNIERDKYIKELTEGKYRDMQKIKISFEQRNIEINKI